MSKEEIALQLTLKKLDCLQFTAHCSSPSLNADFNIKLGEEIASIYNTIYSNLKLDDIITV